MTYMRRVQVHHYKHKLTKGSQWTDINKQLHAKLVLAKDTELLYGQVHIKNIMNAQVTVPSLNDVQATLALEPTAGAP
ncbi:hypothetical protein PSHT_14159 [Puccinia striiformis]|uniref:Uncharacterized protein n=1 Tax=Puccinia striiformis TaxID=27350 RepID=A0A2S4ULP5_9BASI|nr:hypothetical protein PSHT_14159 [Puccinia striiformis]